MQLANGSEKIDGLKIAYIGGGSRNWAYVLMVGLAMEDQLSGVVKLFDIDQRAAQENAAMGNRLYDRADAVGKWRYETVGTLKEALTGADFVILSILPGNFQEMRSDVHAPEKYGVWQSVGDTVGPGGIVRSLRTIPMYMDFAESIRAYCPDAWVINYTNPMSVCTRTLYKVFPKVKAFGCCHEVFESQHDAAAMASASLGLNNVTRNDIHTNVLGINHFTWIDRISCGSTDLMPVYRDFADRYAESGYEREEVKTWRNSVFRCRNKVKFDLLRRFGIIAAAGDRHLAEFMPPWYLKNPETVEQWGFALTTVNWRIQDRLETEERRRRMVSGEEQLELKATGEEGIRQIKAVLGLGDFVTNVNLPNRGQIEGLPVGAVVETNALFSRNCVSPVFAGRLPEAVEAMVLRHINNQEMLVNASLLGDRQMAFHAFSNDPQLSYMDIRDIETLFAEMLSNTGKYLPGYLL
jgi:galacturan 1,4-alpha-galacturonidase